MRSSSSICTTRNRNMERASACVSCNTHLVDQARHEDVYGVSLLISHLAWQRVMLLPMYGFHRMYRPWQLCTSHALLSVPSDDLHSAVTSRRFPTPLRPILCSPHLSPAHPRTHICCSAQPSSRPTHVIAAITHLGLAGEKALALRQTSRHPVLARQLKPCAEQYPRAICTLVPETRTRPASHVRSSA
jgi:hypothetical protein